MRKILFGIALGLIAAVVQAGDVLSLKAGHPQTYVVKKGDTLWDISGMFLDDPWLWPELWHYNPQVENPHLIYPGDVLHLVWRDGKPMLVRNPKGSGPSGVVKLTPQMRISEASQAIPAIPLDVVAPFLSRSRVVSEDELENAPYVLAGQRGNIVAGAGDSILGRGDFGELENFGIYRRGQEYRDPVTGERLGIEAIDIGTVHLLATEDDVSTLAVNRSTQEIRRADRFLPLEERQLTARFEPDAPDEDVAGFIIAVDGGVTQIGGMDVVTLNLGERNGIEAGDVLAIYSSGVVVRDPVKGDRVKAPDVRAGLLMVFRVFEKVSYGLVLQAEQALKVGDKLRNP
ncbi:LysM peptidoglycan-binding domain-containing protein [Spongiibacter nanhainus]|uniref:LysM peptidoglycan-binding domain-containing protein n=1 Tax=Spongiibacter nanhainus TaxID=2794344 RepID=A0A7T4R0Z1_9GAMM|nr:LysM domain-containing protein [Spongiibacter nanhainus]QQD18312.1 LysM peptidoglycan-binding domain-containing protein [Spongiibacter nanhainus]